MQKYVLIITYRHWQNFKPTFAFCGLRGPQTRKMPYVFNHSAHFEDSIIFSKRTHFLASLRYLLSSLLTVEKQPICL